jgi:hypothetical protein
MKISDTVNICNNVFKNVSFEQITRFSALQSDLTMYLVYQRIAFINNKENDVKKYGDLYNETITKIIDFTNELYEKHVK